MHRPIRIDLANFSAEYFQSALRGDVKLTAAGAVSQPLASPTIDQLGDKFAA